MKETGNFKSIKRGEKDEADRKSGDPGDTGD